MVFARSSTAATSSTGASQPPGFQHLQPTDDISPTKSVVVRDATTWVRTAQRPKRIRLRRADRLGWARGGSQLFDRQLHSDLRLLRVAVPQRPPRHCRRSCGIRTARPCHHCPFVSFAPGSVPGHPLHSRTRFLSARPHVEFACGRRTPRQRTGMTLPIQVNVRTAQKMQCRSTKGMLVTSNAQVTGVRQAALPAVLL